VDAIVVDAGSMAWGPYYLGAGEQYFPRSAVKLDYRAHGRGGSGNRALRSSSAAVGWAAVIANLAAMTEIAKEVFTELGVRDARSP